MPTYGYRCKEHGPFDDMCAISHRNDATQCPQCGALSQRDTEWELNTATDFDITTKVTRYSNAMGCQPSQIKEMERRYPGSRYRSDGALEVVGRKDKLHKMKERGMAEFDRSTKFKS